MRTGTARAGDRLESVHGHIQLAAADLGPERRPSTEIGGTVDPGPAYSTLPARLLRELGVEPAGLRLFLPAAGRCVDMDTGQAWVSINGERVVRLVVFGEGEAPTLLGADTLEGLALAVDPVEQRLVPTPSSCTEARGAAVSTSAMPPAC